MVTNSFSSVKEKTAKDSMKTLLKNVHLMRKLFNLKMLEGTYVPDHINKFNVIMTQRSSIDITFEDEVKPLILLNSLPEN